MTGQHEAPGLVYVKISTASILTYFGPVSRPANPDDPLPPPEQSSIPDPDGLLQKHLAGRKMQRKKYKKASHSLQQTPQPLSSPLVLFHPDAGMNLSRTFVSLFQLTSACSATEEQERALAAEEKSRQG